MAYTATPNTTTGYSPFFLMHGREMTLPSNEDLKAKVDKANTSLKQCMAKLQASLKAAYKATGRANNVAHRKNKFYYDCCAKQQEFKVYDSVYLHTTAGKEDCREISENPGRVHTRLLSKFRTLTTKFWVN
jgi:hypothetical protein